MLSRRQAGRGARAWYVLGGGLVGGIFWLMWSFALGASGESHYDRHIGRAARRYGLEPALVKAVIKCESDFDPRAVSPRGAQGLMQLMPATQTLLDVPDGFEPQQNIDAGARYLAMLRQTFSNDASLMLAAYNAGSQAVIAAGYGVPPFAETQRYVACVLTARHRYRRHGLNERFAPTSQMTKPTAGQRTLILSPLRFSHQVARVGERLTLSIEAFNAGSRMSHGVVMLTYPEHLVSMMMLHTSERETTVRLPGWQNGQLVKAAWNTTVYRLMQGRWPEWWPGQRQTASLVLIPRRSQDLALHLSVLLYDAAETTVRYRWSTVVRIPVRTSPW